MRLGDKTITEEELASIIADPLGHEAAGLAPEQAKVLATKLLQAIPALVQRALAGGDRLIGPEAAAKLLDCSSRFIRDNARKLPFTLKLGSEWKCSEHAIQRFIAERKRHK